jgi:uncharacterized protein (TIGR03066 family)
MIRAFATIVAVAYAAPAIAAEKFDEAKLIGSWILTKSKGLPEGTKATLTFGKDKTATAAIEITGMKIEFKGTWKLDGDKLVMASKEGDREKVETDTIIKLTDDELVTKDMAGDETEFKKKK